ncbi:MAG: hypothetical protein JHC31_15640 [Sulfurihydrogenibium sp.]|nr:hypothetical protein [Sulfurihydrogenibium sp.]
MSVMIVVQIPEFDLDVLKETATENNLKFLGYGEHFVFDRTVKGYAIKGPFLEYPIVFKEDGDIVFEVKDQDEKEIVEGIISLYNENLIKKKIKSFAINNGYRIEEGVFEYKLLKGNEEIRIKLLSDSFKVSVKGVKGKKCEALVNQIIGENAKVLEKQHTQEYYLESFESQQKENKNLNIL